MSSHPLLRRTPVVLVSTAVVALVAVGVTACTSHSVSGAGSPTTAGSSASSPGASASNVVAISPTSTESAAPTPPTSAAAAQSLISTGSTVNVTDYQVGSYSPTEPARAMPGITQFVTPSGNIRCTLPTSATTELMCNITAYSFAKPTRPADCTLDFAGGLLYLTDSGATLGQCVGGEMVTFASRTLAYGQVLTSEGFSCYSGAAALTCLDTHGGHGFSLSRDALHTF